jgi:hypothetical protein
MSYSQLSSLAIIIAAISTVRAEDLCYRISYNCDSNVENCENSLLVQPLDKINAGHELLTSAQCGSTYSVNQPIPATGKWSNNGATSSSSSSCYNVDGGGLMYAYNHPKHSSSNTGFESVEKAQFLFLVDEADSLYFLIGLDKYVPFFDLALFIFNSHIPSPPLSNRPNNADGGKFALQIESVAGSLAGTTVSLYDDTRGNTFPSSSWNSCFNYGQDRFAWDSVNGRGSMRWYWATCCTDGAVISGLPSGSGVEGNIEFTIKMLQPTSYHYHSREPDGLDSFMFPSWDTHNNEFQHPITEGM